jgi:hypothetical protein
VRGRHVALQGSVLSLKFDGADIAVSESLGINAGWVGNPDKFACPACIQFPFKDDPHESHSIGRYSVAAQLVDRADVRRQFVGRHCFRYADEGPPERSYLSDHTHT